MSGWRLSVALAGAGALFAACGRGPAPCTQDCPDLAGRYALAASLPAGACPFVPYLLGPTVLLEQPPERSSVTARIIDPVSQLELALSGPVFSPGPRDGQSAVGSFSASAQVIRPADENRELVTLEVVFSGSAYRVADSVRLSADLTTAAIDGPGAGCFVNVAFSGVRVDPPRI